MYLISFQYLNLVNDVNELYHKKKNKKKERKKVSLVEAVEELSATVGEEEVVLFEFVLVLFGLLKQIGLGTKHYIYIYIYVPYSAI